MRNYFLVLFLGGPLCQVLPFTDGGATEVANPGNDFDTRVCVSLGGPRSGVKGSGRTVKGFVLTAFLGL